MPTVILLDISLSMSRPVQSNDPSESHTRYSLACSAINCFLDYLSIHAKLEYVALITFSTVCEVLCPFTREYDTIKLKVRGKEELDKTSIDVGLKAVNQLVLSEWGHQTPMQIILITDGCCGAGQITRNKILSNVTMPSPFPAKLQILTISTPSDPLLTQSLPLYQKLIDLTGGINQSKGAIYTPDQLSVAAVSAVVNKLCEREFVEFTCWLKCGKLESRVWLFPPPENAITDIQVCGFLSTQDLGTPISMSKHIIIPQVTTNPPSAKPKEGVAIDLTEDDTDPSKIPNFCVLLHGALKVEGMACIVQLGENWWGAVCAWSEARMRRSCLQLAAFPVGITAAPWLGPIDLLGPAEEEGELFPVRAVRSYSSGAPSAAAWTRPHALLADVQKVLRHARKLPDKTQHLFKELNRIRRYAICLGFGSLLNALAAMLERECAGANGEAALQLSHAAAALTDPRHALDAKKTLQPMPSTL